MIILHKFGDIWGIADGSPFCVKLESFLRLSHAEFKFAPFNVQKTMKQAPKGKVPFITLENGKLMGDSTMIIQHLCKRDNIDLNKELGDEQRAISYAFCQMLDESLYFIALYSRWIDEKGWAVIKDVFFRPVPSLLRSLISGKVRKDIIKSAKNQGIARHTQKEVYERGRLDLAALSNLLGEDKWFFGTNEPNLLDIWAHSFVINLISVPIETDLKQIALEYQNICDHAHRFQDLVYSNADQEIKTAA